MTTTDATLRSRLIRVAHRLPKGNATRTKLITILAEAQAPVAPAPGDFDPKNIGKTVPGALEEGTPEQDYHGNQFTQQEFHELGDKQEKGALGMEVDDTEKAMPPGQQERQAAVAERALFDGLLRLAHANREARGPVLTMLREAGYITPEGKVASDKFAGCEKLPAGKMRDNCESGGPVGKKNKGKDDDKGKDDGKMPADLLEKFKGKKKADLRETLIRLAHANPDMRARLLPVIQVHDATE